MAPRLDDGDYKTICNTYKYKALKKETTSKDLKDQMLTLTREGIIYLKESCGVNVNTNGEKRQDGNPFTPISTSRHKDAQRYDNRLINLLLTYYTEPKM